MKKIILLITFILCSCSNQKKLDGFGDLKIGMSISQFNDDFPNLKFSDTETRVTKKISLLEISENIVLKDISIVFDNHKLISIGTSYSKELLNVLKTEYGANRTIKKDGYETIYFNTNCEDIACLYESKNGRSGIVIFKTDFLHDKI